MTVYLSAADVAQIVEHALGEPLDSSLNDVGLLAGAVARPRAVRDHVDVYQGLALKAAALLESLARSNALVDGNKRTAWVAMNVFLELNHHRTTFTENEAFILVQEVAHGHVKLPGAAERIAARLERV